AGSRLAHHTDARPGKRIGAYGPQMLADAHRYIQVVKVASAAIQIVSIIRVGFFLVVPENKKIHRWICKITGVSQDDVQSQAARELWGEDFCRAPAGKPPAHAADDENLTFGRILRTRWAGVECEHQKD